MADFIHIGNLKKDNASNIANILDTNKDGQLSREEFSVFDEKAATLGLKDGQIKRAKKQIENLFNVTDPGEAPQTRRERVAAAREEAHKKVFDLAKSLKGEGPQYTDNILNAVNEQYRDENGMAVNRHYRRALNELQEAAEAEIRTEVINPVIDSFVNTSTGAGNNSRTDNGKDVTNDGLTKGKHIKQQTKQELKTSGAWDSQLVRKAFRDGNGRQAFYGEDSAVTDRCDYQAAVNRTEQRNVQTDAEIMENFDGRIDILNTMMDKEVVEYDQMGKLTGNNIKLIYKDEQGNWHLDGLQQEIQNYIGADLELNRDSDTHRYVAELKNLHERLKGLTGDNTLTKQDVKAIVEGCGFDIEPKAWQDFVIKPFFGAGAGAGAGAAAAQRGYDIIPVIDDTIIHNLKLILDDETFEGGITTEMFIQRLGKAIPVAGNVARSTLIGTLVPLALSVIEGIEDDGQVPTIDTTLPEEHKQNRDAYLSSLDNHPYRAAIEVLTLAFKNEDGSWDAESYETFLGRLSSDGDPDLNRNELLAGLEAIKTEKITTEFNQEKPIEQTIEVTGVDVPQETPTQVTMTWENKHTWPAIIYAYYGVDFDENSSWAEIKPYIDAFKQANGIKKSDALPVGQEMELKAITVNGKPIEPTNCNPEELQDAINKFGWKSKFYSGSTWTYNGTYTKATLSVKAVQVGTTTMYRGVLKDSNGKEIATTSNKTSADAAINTLKASAGDTTRSTSLTIKVTEVDGSSSIKRETLEPKK